jgi:hypothetical protein
MWYKLKQKFIDLNDDCGSQSQLVQSAWGSHILKFLLIELGKTFPIWFPDILSLKVKKITVKDNNLMIA